MKIATVDCTTGEQTTRTATVAEQTQAQTDAQAATIAAAAAQQIQANLAIIQSKLQTALNANVAWLTANPKGATLTAAQTESLIQQLNDLTRLTIGLLLDVSQLNTTTGT